MMRIRGILSVIFLLFIACQSSAAEVKEADLAGSWYPDSKIQLEKQLKSYLNAANPPKVDGDILALIVPHAGYIYSGPIAAYGYKAIQNKSIKTIIILGFSHRKFFDGIAVYDRGMWKTPLGDIEIDEQLAKEMIAENSRVKFNPDLFKEENSVEMQVPFIQMVLKGVKIVPIAFGTKDAQSLAGTLEEILRKRRDVLIVASTDMSHYHPYDDANSIDKHTINTINRLKAKELYDEGALGICEMCGIMPVVTSLIVAQNMDYDKIKILKYANSGDITGDKSKVVGYVSSVIYKEVTRSPSHKVISKKEARMLNDGQRKRLLQIARESIISYVKDGKRRQFIETDPVLNKPMGAFVTLHEAGELRGCIGNMVGQGPLCQTVADMAVEAATDDLRFRKLLPDEIDKIELEISVLSPLQRVKSADEIKIPGNGVIVKRGFNSGVYLPQVAVETGWDKEEFLNSLCAHKAGLPSDAWKDPSTEIYIFTAEVFGEKGER